MTNFWALYHQHITCELIPAVLDVLALIFAWRHDGESHYRKRVSYRLKVILLASIACGLASNHPYSPLVTLVPLATFGAAHLLDSLVYVLGSPAEWSARHNLPQAMEEEKRKMESSNPPL